MSTTIPAPAPAGDPDPGHAGAVDQADQVLAGRARDAAEHLAALITHGMLQHTARPDRLPELLYPNIPPDHVRAVWDAALAVGYYAGQLAARPRWQPDALRTARTALTDAGYTTMATTTRSTGDPHTPAPGEPGTPHPADTTAHRSRP